MNVYDLVDKFAKKMSPLYGKGIVRICHGGSEYIVFSGRDTDGTCVKDLFYLDAGIYLISCPDKIPYYIANSFRMGVFRNFEVSQIERPRRGFFRNDYPIRIHIRKIPYRRQE